MMRILGVNLPDKKKVDIALTHIYGVGISTAKKALKELNIDEMLKLEQLNKEQISNLRNFFENSELRVEGNLKRFTALKIKRLIDIKCYRGLRHIKALPTRGQRTRTNSRTSRKR